MNEDLEEVVCEVIERDQRTGKVGRTRARALGKLKESYRLPSETPIGEAPVLERHDEGTIVGVSLEHGQEWHEIDVGDFHVACLMKDIVLGRMHRLATKRHAMIVKHIDRFVDSSHHVLTRIYRTYEDEDGDRLSLTWRYYSPIALCEWRTAVLLPADATMGFAERYLSEAYRPPAPSGDGDGVVLRGWSEDMVVRLDAADLLTAQRDHLEGIADRAERLATETRADGNKLGISEWRLESLPTLKAVLDRAVEEGLAERTCERGVELWRSKA